MKTFRALALLSLAALVSCMPPPRSAGQKKPAKIESVAGRIIPNFSISIDANYDPRLNNLIPGYKILPVIVKNMSLRNVIMDAKRDKWVVVGEKGQKYVAVNSLRLKDRVQWREIPERMRALIDYPEIVPINYSSTFDVLLPEKAKLDYFREIRYYNADWKQEFLLEKDY